MVAVTQLAQILEIPRLQMRWRSANEELERRRRDGDSIERTIAYRDDLPEDLHFGVEEVGGRERTISGQTGIGECVSGERDPRSGFELCRQDLKLRFV